MLWDKVLSKGIEEKKGKRKGRIIIDLLERKVNAVGLGTKQRNYVSVSKNEKERQ